MPMNSTKITANTQLSSIGGTFDGILFFNGGTASTVSVFDNNNADVVVPFNFNNDPTIDGGPTAGLSVGMLVFGDGIPEGATVASITDPTTFELSASTTGGSKTSESLTFISVDNPIGKFLLGTSTSDDIRGLGIICRNGIKIVASNFTSIELFALTN